MRTEVNYFCLKYFEISIMVMVKKFGLIIMTMALGRRTLAKCEMVKNRGHSPIKISWWKVVDITMISYDLLKHHSKEMLLNSQLCLNSPICTVSDF